MVLLVCQAPGLYILAKNGIRPPGTFAEYYKVKICQFSAGLKFFLYANMDTCILLFCIMFRGWFITVCWL